LNTVLETSTDLEPGELLAVCLNVEQQNNRRRDTSKGPRTLDIDIIFYGRKVIRQPGLSIPHPSFSTRRFVLAPLVEIAPDWVDPLSGRTIQYLFEVCPDRSSVTRAGVL
jgi:2-amino-4-hydroxy-6-hydroxymethyldihydropteridine diphosphokinase